MIIREGSIDEVLEVNEQILEFTTPYGKPYERTSFEHRFAGIAHLILIAEEKSLPVGFKVGYELSDSVFYSWLGGVVPGDRGKGIARRLMRMQEQWVLEQGYSEIRVKSRNRFTAMLRLLLDEGYLVTGVEPKEDPLENRIHFNKLMTVQDSSQNDGALEKRHETDNLAIPDSTP